MENTNDQSAPAPVMSQGSTMSLPSAIELLVMSKDLIMKRASFFLMVAAIPAVLRFIGEVSVMSLNPLLMMGSIIFFIASVILGVYATIALIKGVDDESMLDWKDAYNKAKGSFWAFVLVALIVGIVTSIGYVLLVIPGVYLSIAFGFYTFTFVLEGARGWDAAKKSKELVKGYWWAVLGRWVVFAVILGLVISILGGIIASLNYQFFVSAFNLLVGLFVMPLGIAYSYLMYKKLVEIKKMSGGSAPSTPAAE